MLTEHPKIDRAYVATEAERAEMAQACGIPAKDVRCAETKGQHYQDWTARKGKLVAVRNLTVAGKKRGDMVAFVRHVQAQGADVYEIDTGNYAGTGVEMLNRALAIVHRDDRRMGERAAEMGRKPKPRNPDRMSPEDARLIWGNLKKAVAECVAETGWPKATAMAKGAFCHGGREKLAKQIAEESRALRKRKTKR